MHCGVYVHRVTDVLGIIEGAEVNSVAIGSARVTFDPKWAAAEKTAGAVNQIGFTVRSEK